MIKQYLVRMEAAITASLEKAVDLPLPPHALFPLSNQLFGHLFANSAHMDGTMQFVEAVRPLVVDVLGFLDTCTYHDASDRQCSVSLAHNGSRSW